jgi:hypothetical protein
MISMHKIASLKLVFFLLSMFILNPAFSNDLFETGSSVSDSSAWVTVNTNNTYQSMVVVATPIYGASDTPAVLRVRNVTSNSFEVKYERLDGLTAAFNQRAFTWFAVDEGVYTAAEHGITMEAVKFTSTLTDENDLWAGQTRTYQNTYSSPVVFGQVMSANDQNWSVFWCSGSSATEPPSASALKVGKHVGEDPNNTRQDETIGYIVIESGSYDFATYSLTTALGSDTITGLATGDFYSTAAGDIAGLTQAAMDGGDGSFPVIRDSANTTQLAVSVDEDILGDTERDHTTEQLAYILIYDLTKYKEALGQTINSVNVLLTNARLNTGVIEGTYNLASIANLEYDLALAQSVYNDTTTTAPQHRQANLELISKMNNLALQGASPEANLVIASHKSVINFNDFTVVGYGGSQDSSGTSTIEHTGLTLHLNGNRWKAIEFPYTVTENTVLEFDFSSSNQGEVHGIGLDTDLALSESNFFQVYGTQPYGVQNFLDYSGSGTKRYTINVGDYFTGSFQYLLFAIDDDANATGDSVYSNIKVYETPLSTANKQSFIWNTADQVLSSDSLRAEHYDLYNHLITYKVLTLPNHGELKVNGISLTEDLDNAGSFLPTFTQADIDNGLVTFTPDSSHSNDYFSFNLSDITGASLNDNVFEIVIDSDGDSIDDATEIAGTTDWNNADTDGDGETDDWEIAHGADPAVNALAPAVAAIQGENGLSASFFFDAYKNTNEFSLISPMKVTKVTSPKVVNGQVSNSGKSNNVGARFEGYLNSPAAGLYELRLNSDDGSRLYIDDVEIITNDGAHSNVEKTASITLSAGLHKLRLDYFEAGGSSWCDLQWDGPGRSLETIPDKYFYLSATDHLALEVSVDRDGDGLTDIEENTITLSDPELYDTDGDLLSDGVEINKWGTDPTLFDTDADGISDYDEVMLFGSNPSNADITGFTELTTINGAAFTGSLGSWYAEGTAAYCADLRGYVEYDVDIPADGIYKIEVELTQNNEEPGYTPIPLIFYVDGNFISRQVSDINYGEIATQTFITPYVKAGTRKIKIFWDNYHFDTYAQINSLKLISIDGPDADNNGIQDWVDYNLGAQMTFEIPQESRISPMSIEGNTRFLNQLNITTPTIVTAKRSNLNKWYANVPLDASAVTTVIADWCNGVKSISRPLTWEQTNLFESDEIVIPLGSSLLLNAVPQGAVDGTSSLTYIPTAIQAGLWYGTVAGNINVSDVNPKSLVTTSLSQTEDSIAGNTTEIYTGQMFDADGQISFTEYIDDKVRLYIDGVLVLSDDTWNTRTSTGNLNLTPGWHTFELRISNGGGPGGPVTTPGFGYDPDGGTNWVHPSDPGDASLFRTNSPGLAGVFDGLTPVTPFEQLFDTAGEVIINGVYTDTFGVEQTASITVKVIAPQSEEVLNIWINRDRDWIATSSLSGEVVIDAPDVDFSISNNMYKITRHELYEDVSIVLRLGEGGPILSATPTHCFALIKGVDGTLPIDTVFEDGTLLAYDTLVGLNLPAGINLKYYMTASGVSFDDGSTTKNLNNTSFSDLGVLRLGLLRLPGRTGSFCTKFSITQGSTSLGTN